MTLVLDASIAASWVWADESGAEGLQDDSAYDFLVPAVFPSEIVYLLDRARRRERIQADEIEDALMTIGALSIVVATERRLNLLRLRELSLTHVINAYDAMYLLLAWERELPLATLDARLAAAARSLGLVALP